MQNSPWLSFLCCVLGTPTLNEQVILTAIEDSGSVLEEYYWGEKKPWISGLRRNSLYVGDYSKLNRSYIANATAVFLILSTCEQLHTQYKHLMAIKTCICHLINNQCEWRFLILCVHTMIWVWVVKLWMVTLDVMIKELFFSFLNVANNL